MAYKIFLLVCIIFCAVIGYWYFNKDKQKSGIVIVLNGPSASGKSSIQCEFQYLMMPKIWIKLGIDTLFDKPMPDITLENMSYWQSPNSIRWVTQEKDAANNQIIVLHMGEEGKKVFYGMNKAIVAYAKAGCNSIVDYIAYDTELFNDLQQQLQDNGIKVVYVAVDIPLNVLEEREKARGTSPVGHARSHYHHVYGTVSYNLRVDSSKNTAAEIAQQIKDYIEQL